MVCCDIGIEAPDARVHRLAQPSLFPPADGAHKYTRGLVVAVAGEMAGASALSAEAAARAGAGYVRLLGAQAILHTPHAIVRASLRDEAALHDRRIGALLIGPGLGRGDAAAGSWVSAGASSPAVLVGYALASGAGTFAALPGKGDDAMPEFPTIRQPQRAGH
jgi:NAD(P)H-hydrate repair Nnr-like enzyme with NAD(P)H-hydrate dehydratase domain